MAAPEPAPRRLPQDEDAEEVVCAALVSGGSASLAEVADVVQPQDFAHPAREAILSAALSLDGAAKPVHRVALAAELTRLGLAKRLEQRGGATWLAQLSQTLVPMDELRGCAERVRDLARRRRVIVEASKIVDLGYRDDGDPVAFLAEAQRRISGAVEVGMRARARSFGELIRSSRRRLDQRYEQEGEGQTAIPTGFAEINIRLAGGLHPGRVLTVAGRPGDGKTSLGIQFGINAAKVDVPGLIFSLEMLGDDLADRAVVQEARVDAGRFSSGKLLPEEWGMVDVASSRLATAPVDVDDSTDVTLSELRAKARRWRAEHPGPAWILVDYLQLMGVGDVPGAESMSDDRLIGRFSKGIAQLAKELHVAVIQIAALNREVEKRGGAPKMSDLRGSGQIEYDSAAVALIWHHPKGCQIEWGKNRFGSKEPVHLQFTGASTRFDPRGGV